MASFPWGVVGHAHYNDYRWSFVGRPIVVVALLVVALIVVCLFVVMPLLLQLVSFG